MRQHRLLLALFVLVVSRAGSVYAGSPPSGIYWSNIVASTPQGVGTIWRADFDGSNVTPIVTEGLSGAWAIFIEITTHKIYWADVNLQRIQRANLDGSSVETVVSGPFSFIEDPGGIAVDPVNQRLYWTDFLVDKIARTDLSTHTTVTLVTSDMSIPRGIDLDLAAGFMYWVDGGTGKLRRATLNGGGVQDLITGLNNPGDLELDFENGNVYWTLTDPPGGIWRAKLDGTNVEPVILDSAYFLGLDRLERKLYWVHYLDGVVRADLNGSNREIVIPRSSETLSFAQGIAIVHDCNNNQVDDYQEVLQDDCNKNRQPDDCDIATDHSPDCNRNVVPDECDLSAGISHDDDANGIPDECDPGACCDASTGVCTDDTPVTRCTGFRLTWTANTPCADLDRACVSPVGACCDQDPFSGCTDGLTRAECSCELCEWTDDALCDDVACPHDSIPTVSTWGLAILSLLLLTGAKIRFGRVRHSEAAR